MGQFHSSKTLSQLRVNLMALDNSPRIRQAKKLARKQGKLVPADRILIVSEGSKTEPQYFNEIRNALRLPTANVCVMPSDYGTSPDQVYSSGKRA